MASPTTNRIAMGKSSLQLAQENVINQMRKIVTPSNIKRMIFFDKNSGKSLTDQSPNKQNATTSLDCSALNPATAGNARVLNFNATGDYWDVEDADDLSFGNGTTDSPFSIVACINPNTTTPASCIVAKRDGTTGNTKNEYNLQFSASKLEFYLLDNSAGSYIGKYYNTSIIGHVGSYHTYVASTNGNSLNTGLELYADGISVGDSPVSSGIYTSMDNTGSKVGNYAIATTGAKERIASYKGAFIAIIAEELSQAQVTAIDTLLRKYVGAI